MDNGNKSDSRFSRWPLALLIIVFLIAVAATATAACLGLIPWYGLSTDLTLESLLVLTGFLLMFILLSSLPLLMILGYRQTQQKTLLRRVAQDLLLCGLTDTHLKVRVAEFKARNSYSAFVLPALVNLAFLVVMWSVTLMPGGLTGLAESISRLVKFESDYYLAPDFRSFFLYLADEASIVTWAFLGAYFYTLSVVIRRWLRSDLTSGAVWKVDVRVAVALVVGLLLTKAMPDTHPAIAFVAGIVPDTALRWLTLQGKRLLNIEEGEGWSTLFQPGNLQGKISGMTFWQADRLFEEGIESVEDLAMKEIPDLLTSIRIDTPRLLYWVDQALLCNQVGDHLAQFKRASILTCSDLLDLINYKQFEGVVKSMQDVESDSKADDSKAPRARISAGILENIVIGVKTGPNLAYVQEYWRNTGSVEDRAASLALAPKWLSQTDA